PPPICITPPFTDPFFILVAYHPALPELPSFPTRRSSDLLKSDYARKNQRYQYYLQRSERLVEQYNFRQYCAECPKTDEHCIDCTNRQVFSSVDHQIETSVYCDKCENPFIPAACMGQADDPADFEDACSDDFYPLHIHKDPP